MADQYIIDTKHHLSIFQDDMQDIRQICNKDISDRWDNLESEIEMLLDQYQSKTDDLESANEIINDAGLNKD